METYVGYVRTPADAIKLFEACRLGLLPRVQRRLSEKERQSIKSGSVFVWDEREAGMRRWTDGKSWSASRVSGSFLTYREMEGKRGGGNFVPTPRQRVAGKTPDSGRGSDEDADMDGEGPDGYRYKPDGLMKQSFSITTSNGQHLHLISYYARPHANSQELLQPTADPALRHIVPVKGMYPESTVHEQVQPAVTRAPLQNYMNTPPQMTPGPPPHNLQRQTHPYQVTQGYTWPPSPVATPPYNYQVGNYGSQLPMPGSAHSSPRQYPSHHPPQSGPPIAVQSTAFDRPPPPLQDPSLPPPAPSHHRSSSGAQQPGPIYAANPSPRAAQARLIAEQQVPRSGQQPQQQTLKRSPMIDPRIMSAPLQQHTQSEGHLHPSSAAQQNGTHASYSANQGQHGGANGSGTNGSTKGSAHSSQAPPSQNIPSISALVHNHAPSSNPNAEATADARSNVSNGSVSRGGSASPRQNGEAGAPQDIPHAKLGFGGEDLRALRVLDRKFCI